MNCITRVPMTFAAIISMTLFLSGCIAVDAASTAIDAGASTVSTAGDIVTSPFDSDDSTDNTKN